MEAACQRVSEGDTSSLVDIVNCIDSRKSHETHRLGTRCLTTIINILIHEGAELRRTRGKENTLPSPAAFFATRILAQLGMRQSEDGLEVQRAVLILGLQRCRDLCLDAYFLLGRPQRYYVIMFVKQLMILYGCTPHDLLQNETSINMLTGALETAQATTSPSGPVSAAEAVVPASSRGGNSRSATRSAPSPPPPRDSAPSSSRPPNIQNRSALLVSIPGASFDLPLRATRRYRDLPKKPISAPFAVNPLYEDPSAPAGGNGELTVASRADTPIPLSPEPAPLVRSTAPEITIPAQFPTPVVLFSSYYGLGCVPRLPTADDLARLDAWRLERQQQPAPPRDVQKSIIKTAKGTAEGGDAGREFGKMRLVALRSSPSSPAPEAESQSFQVHNEHTFASSNTAAAAYQQQCLRSALLQQYVDHGKLLSWGSAAKGALGPLRQRRGTDIPGGSRRTSANSEAPFADVHPSRDDPTASAQRSRSSGGGGAGGVKAVSSKAGTVVGSGGATAKTGNANSLHPGSGSVATPLTSTLTATPVPHGDADGAGSVMTYTRGGPHGVSPSQPRNEQYVYLPTPVNTTARVATIACGLSVTYVVTTDNVLYSCGRGENGQLGIGERSLRYTESGTNRLQRVLLKEEEAITRVAAGAACAVALAGDRALYCWGHNVYGQCLKLPDQSRVLTPVRLKTSKYTVLDICFGQFFGVLLFDDGMMGTWGIASMLGCTVGAKGLEDSLAPDQCKCARQVVHLELGSECAMAAVRAGPWHALAISKQGEVYTWGVGRDGRLGHGTDASEIKPRLVEGLRSCFVVDASCASGHSAVLTSTGSVYVFGENSEGQLGLRGRTPRRLPMMMPLPGKAVAVACAREHTCVLLEDGDVVACGSYRSCGIGLGYGTRLCAPARILTNYTTLTLQCGHFHSLAGALHRRTALMMVGHSSIEEVSRISSVVVRNGVCCAGSGVGFLVVLSENNSLVSIGRGERGQLGIGDCMKPSNKDDVTMTPKFTPVHLPKGVVIHHLRCGPDYVLAIDQDGVVYGWGSNEHQKLSQPAQVDYAYTPVRLSGYGQARIVQVACGGSFVVALTADGEVLAHGEATYCGQAAASQPRKGGGGGCISTPTRIAALHDIVSIAAGRRHAIAMTSSCNIFAWGVGVLGGGASAAPSVMSTTPVRVALSQNIRSIGCGAYNSFAITEEGELWVWGLNCYGECGVSPHREGGSAAPHMGPASPAGTGAAPAAIETPISVARQVRDAAFTSQFGLVVFEDGQVRVSGRIRHGGRKYLIPSFHSTPQPTFSVDVNEPVGRRSQSGELSLSSGLSRAENAATTAAAAPRHPRKGSNQEVVDLEDGDEEEEEEEGEEDGDDASSTHSSCASTPTPQSFPPSDSASLPMPALEAGPRLLARRAVSATTAETRRPLPLPHHQQQQQQQQPPLPTGESIDHPAPFHRRSTGDSRSEDPLSGGSARAAAAAASTGPKAPGSSPRLPPVRPTSGQTRSTAVNASSGASKDEGVGEPLTRAPSPPPAAHHLLPSATYAGHVAVEDLGSNTSALDLGSGTGYFDQETLPSPDVSINRERNFPEPDDGSPLQLPLDTPLHDDTVRPGDGVASGVAPRSPPPLSLPRPPVSAPPPTSASRPLPTTTTSTTTTATAALAAPKKKKTRDGASPGTAALTTSVTTRVSGSGLSRSNTPGARAGAAPEGANTLRNPAKGSGTPPPSSSSSSPTASAGENGIFGVRCFPGWEQICTVMEKHRPLATEARMAQVGLQVLLHQPRNNNGETRFSLN